MDTRENNNVLARVRGLYFSESINKDNGLPSGVKRVGGTIFYIDDTASGIYEFFDADGNVIEAVHVGDKPYSYRVIEKG